MREASPDTLLTDLYAATPDAVARLKQLHPAFDPETGRALGVPEIGRASCRERV